MKIAFFSMLFFATGLIVLSQFKYNSAAGRYYIWRVSITNMFPLQVSGIGFGQFPHQYQLWQINYFKCVDYNQFFANLADLPNNAFNEPLQFFIETGVIGLAELILLIVAIFSLNSGNPLIKYNAILVVARLDRLGRDVEQIVGIMKSDVEIIVIDNPQANRFTIHILAAVAEEQRRRIIETTKAALGAAKKRGVRLGKNGKILSVQNKQAADDFANKILPLLRRLKK